MRRDWLLIPHRNCYGNPTKDNIALVLVDQLNLGGKSCLQATSTLKYELLFINLKVGPKLQLFAYYANMILQRVCVFADCETLHFVPVLEIRDYINLQDGGRDFNDVVER